MSSIQILLQQHVILQIPIHTSPQKSGAYHTNPPIVRVLCIGVTSGSRHGLLICTSNDLQVLISFGR
ncbi:hypothetical protein KC19_12G114400 [Ceratodon purpureus]|uniref:Uncharacterized protein n=1 Tax=Ceratodon purpureus TaxID=3225 RepID=A0A8T0G8F8_CERPU|nr:hypothetical protein KC19_12G114400 [Ceratodon purpureus]